MTYDIRDYINESAIEGEHDRPRTDSVVKNALIGDRVGFVLQGNWEGKVLSAWKLEDDYYAVVSSYFGSCTYCDKFLGVSEEEALDRLRSMCHSARTFSSYEEMKEWCENESQNAENYSHQIANQLDL